MLGAEAGCALLFLAKEARRSLFQWGAETAKGVATVASARALATKRLSRAGGGKAKWVPR